MTVKTLPPTVIKENKRDRSKETETHGGETLTPN